uniref:Uncharacterized protein n=1 Tax=Anopheles coluzzii TaxID=1518534 RepID=A0A8W7Q1J8_ANOCL
MPQWGYFFISLYLQYLTTVKLLKQFGRLPLPFRHDLLIFHALRSTVSIAFLAAAGCFRLRPPGCFAFAGLRFFGFASSSGSIFPAIVSTACCTRLLTFNLLCPTALCTLK